MEEKKRGRRRGRLWLLLALLLSACSALPQVQDSYDLDTPTPRATNTVPPTAVPSGAEGVGLAFFKAWENGDYLGMYSVLSPQSQALIDAQAFVNRYREALDTATVQQVRSQPLSARQNGNRAEIGVRVHWETAVVGTISRDHIAELVYSSDRWGIVWHEGLILPELEGGFRLAMEYKVPARANIYDRNGLGLAFQGTAITLGVIPGQIDDEQALLNALAPILEQTPAEMREKYAAALPDWFVPLGDAPRDVVQENIESISPFLDGRGLRTEERLTRLYYENGVAPHLIGYTAPIPAESVDQYRERGYRGDERVGVAGIERWGESYLSGVRGGELWVVSSTGEFITPVQESDSRQARSIYTTIDRDFQQAVEQALADAFTNHPLRPEGAVVVLDVNNGQVLAMASFPDYDPGIFDAVRPNAAIDLGAVLNDSRRPLLNRAAQGEYPAGSVFKIVTASAGLFSGVYTPDTRYTCTGTWTGLGEEFIKFDWLPQGHGTLDMRQALTQSCNPYFYELGFNLEQLDSYALPNMARAFGLGSGTGIVGVAESPGLIPDPEWKIANLAEGWAPGDAVNMAIGQGFVLVTPLQIANAVAAVANGGTLYRPVVIDRIGSGGGAPEETVPPEELGRLPLTAEQLEMIQTSLFNVTSGRNGTAAFQMNGLRVPTAGKTGTAENPAGESHAWFAGWAPAGMHTLPGGETIDGPEIAIAVIAENAGEGSAVGAPIFRRIVELYYGETPLTPFPWGG